MKDLSEARKYNAKDGTDIHYWVSWKPGMNKKFLFMHPGSANNHSALQTLERGLNERGHPTILLDQRGVGLSRAPANPEFYSFDRFSSDVEGILNQEGIEKPGFVTHSFGFMPVVDYASRTGNVEDITGICASHNFSESVNPILFKLFFNTIEPIEYAVHLGTGLWHSINGRRRPYVNQDLAGKSSLRANIAISDIPSDELKARWAAHKANQTANDITPQLAKLNVPMHLIYGKRDIMVNPYEGREIAKRTKGLCRIDLIDGDHLVPQIHPERVLEVID